MAYRKSARNHYLHYLLMACGAVFAVLILLIEPSKHCIEYACPLWLRSLGIGLGALFALGAAYAIARDWQWGSRIDFEKKELIWWEGYAPVNERRIPVETIASIRIEDSTGDSVLSLRDANGARIPFPGECAPWPWLDWAKEVAAAFPHIKIEDK